MRHYSTNILKEKIIITNGKIQEPAKPVPGGFAPRVASREVNYPQQNLSRSSLKFRPSRKQAKTRKYRGTKKVQFHKNYIKKSKGVIARTATPFYPIK